MVSTTLVLFISLLSSLLLHGDVFGDFAGCPGEVSDNDDCTLLSECFVCNQASDNASSTDILSPSSSYHGCSQCIEGYFLYRRNQCENCNSLFGNECLHCTDITGCQQCANGYKRTLDESCGLYYCQLVDVCDQHCTNCQSNNDPPRCAQCESGYFLGDNTGSNGCLSCDEEYGDECKFCADLQGCQQCNDGFTRVQDPSSGLHYCTCSGDNCITIINFEDLPDYVIEISIADIIPNGYYGLVWPQDRSTARTIYYYMPFVALIVGLPGAQTGLLNGFETFSLAGAPITFGSQGGIQFKLIQFDVVLALGYNNNVNGAEMNCNAYKNGELQFTFGIDSTQLSSSSVTTVNIANNIIIDQFICFVTSAFDGLLTDNFELIFV